ncbi:DUF2236 domain-containing protein [Streptomyces armeniacus]|uniref:DUF2236 domain-containing protein n=1 Tax=Streptomyces armeniacus TaxID=83291 RepID=A0A345XZV3_9ACTN|nr:oxygenase MpaB family protein [Streptomyces armeniacus]AXK37169.1 DUF2236 domain-containing protein [Streptomyces armeniacus]
MLWDLVGDVRALLTTPAAMVMQVAHPAVAAGVGDHSVFRTDPWGRAARSLHSMQLWVYGGERAAAEGERLLRLHRHIRGTDARGRPYDALDPATYAWVHATGFPVMCHAQRYFGRPFTDGQERRLYAEWRCVGQVLGVPESELPRTVEEFRARYARVLAGGLERTAVVRDLLSVALPVPPPDRGPRPLRAVLRAAWPALTPALLRFRRFVTTGLVPPDARAAIGLEWTPRQERRLRRFGRAVRVLLPLLPERLRYLPLARDARRAARRRDRSRA